jgi:hypothetical protein
VWTFRADDFGNNGVSGSAVERPQLSRALDRLEVGDVLTVWKLDRLGRNTRHVLDLIESIRERGAGEGPARSMMLPLPGPRNSRAKASVPPTLARCS